VTSRGKRSRPPEPAPGVVEHMPEPVKPELRRLRDWLAAEAGNPLPPELHRRLQSLILWADWRIDRVLTREQIRYQRCHVVHDFIREYVAKHGTERGSRKYAYNEAAKVLAGPYAGSPATMKKDFLFEESVATSNDPRAVRYRQRLEQRAREADKKRALRRR
jgi:hypothetical protein